MITANRVYCSTHTRGRSCLPSSILSTVVGYDMASVEIEQSMPFQTHNRRLPTSLGLKYSILMTLRANKYNQKSPHFGASKPTLYFFVTGYSIFKMSNVAITTVDTLLQALHTKQNKCLGVPVELDLLILGLSFGG